MEVDVSYMPDEEFANYRNIKYDSVIQSQVDKSLLTGEKMMKKSLNIGDQSSQIAGIFYPTRIDNFITKVRGFRYYGRYMDDSYAIDKSKESLTSLLSKVKN